MAHVGPALELVILWGNGMVMAFNARGEQMPELSGRFTEKLAPCLAAAAEPCRFLIGDWRHGTVPVERESLKHMAQLLEVMNDGTAF